MNDGRIFLAIAGAICLGVFLNGLRFARMSEARVRNRSVQIEMPFVLAKGRSTAEQFRLLGRIMMTAAPIFFLFFAALCFGLFGPVDGLTISF